MIHLHTYLLLLSPFEEFFCAGKINVLIKYPKAVQQTNFPSDHKLGKFSLYTTTN